MNITLKNIPPEQMSFASVCTDISHLCRVDDFVVQGKKDRHSLYLTLTQINTDGAATGRLVVRLNLTDPRIRGLLRALDLPAAGTVNMDAQAIKDRLLRVDMRRCRSRNGTGYEEVGGFRPALSNK